MTHSTSPHHAHRSTRIVFGSAIIVIAVVLTGVVIMVSGLPTPWSAAAPSGAAAPLAGHAPATR